jgi:hypothetical protein
MHPWGKSSGSPGHFHFFLICQRWGIFLKTHRAMKKLAVLFLLSIASGLSAGEVKPYPLKTCIVSDEELDASRKPIAIVHDGHEVRVCCRECKAEFKSDPGKFLKKLPAAE